MNIFRVVFGIMLGIVASILMGVANALNLSQTNRLREAALLLACQMYAIGGGIDEGASSLIESWGPSAIHLLHLLRQRGQIPQNLAHSAYVLDTEDNTSETLQQKFSRGEIIDGVAFKPNQSVLIVNGRKSGAIGKVAGLYDFHSEPLYRLEVNGGEEYAYQSEIKAANV